MSLQARGGIPRILNFNVGTAPTALEARRQFASLTSHIVVRASTNPVRVYFSEEDFTDNVNYWEVATGEANKLDLPIEERCAWFRAITGASDVDLLTLHRKG